MMQVTVKVQIDMSPLKKFQREIDAGLQSTRPGHLRNAIQLWARIYRSFTQERFDKFSKGGGNWAPLSMTTIIARRHGKGGGGKRGGRALGRARASGGGQVSILRDTGALFSAIDPQFSGKPGQYQKDIPFGIEVGFGGPARHKGGRMTIADIAALHQAGARRLPARPILVDPPQSVVAKMAEVMTTAIQRTINDAGRGLGGDV